MPRDSRTVLRSLYTPGSEKFKSLKNHEARHLFVACLLNADDEGRLEGATGSIVDMVPWLFRTFSGHTKAKKAAQQWLQDLRRVRLIDFYKANGKDGKEVIQINGDYVEQQDWNGVKRKPSKLPPPSGRPLSSMAQAISDQKEAVVQSDSQTDSKKVSRKEEDILSNKPEKRSVEWQAVLRNCQRTYRRIATERGLPHKDFGQPGKDSGRLEQFIALIRQYQSNPQEIVSGVENFANELNPNGKKLHNPVSIFLDRAEEYIEAAKEEKESEMGEYPDLSKLPLD